MECQDVSGLPIHVIMHSLLSVTVVTSNFQFSCFQYPFNVHMDPISMG